MTSKKIGEARLACFPDCVVLQSYIAAGLDPKASIETPAEN